MCANYFAILATIGAFGYVLGLNGETLGILGCAAGLDYNCTIAAKLYA